MAQEKVERLAYSIFEFAAATSLSRPTIYRMIARGDLKTTRIGGRQVVPMSEVHRLFG